MRSALFTCSLVATLATVAAPPSTDAPPPPPDWFEVELIVFRQTGPDQSATESWPNAPGRPEVELALELEPFADEVVPFMALPVERSRLAAQWKSLVRSSRFEPFAYFAWVQPPFDRGATPAVRIASPAATTVTATEASVEPAPPFAHAGTVAAVPPPPPPLRTPLDGTATLGLQRYLYLTLDLVLLPPDLPPDLAASASLRGDAAQLAPPPVDPSDPAALAAAPQPFGGFRLTETRRMRSKELHYFDHPMFGVVALVTPRPAPALDAAPKAP
jgi:hypothetical protein